MEFNIPLEIIQGASLEELGNYMQSFTDLYLYIDDSVRLYAVNSMEDIPYDKCVLLREHAGFLLSEEKTDRLIQVFESEVMEYLTQKIEFKEFKGYENEEESEKYEEESEEYEEESAEEDEFDEYKMSNEEFKNKLIEVLDASKEEIEYTDYNTDYNTDISSSQDYLVESVFRIFIRDEEDLECFNAIHINQDTFSEIEIENDLDLRETIIISFTNFLKNKGYDVKVDVDFYDKLFAEMKIYTNKKLDEKTINEIDFSAKLNIECKKFNKSTIFFILRCVNEEDDIYSLQVPLFRLPEDLQKICLTKAENIKVDDIEQFYYKNREMIIKNEGNNLYSLFDMDSFFYLSHLHPNLYHDTWEYNELPVAQFYL